jgi:hypothetical protein
MIITHDLFEMGLIWVRQGEEEKGRAYVPAYDSPAKYNGRLARLGNILTILERNSTSGAS